MGDWLKERVMRYKIKCSLRENISYRTVPGMCKPRRATGRFKCAMYHFSYGEVSLTKVHIHTFSNYDEGLTAPAKRTLEDILMDLVAAEQAIQAGDAVLCLLDDKDYVRGYAKARVEEVGTWAIGLKKVL